MMTFSKTIRALLDNKLLLPQHISNIESLQHSVAYCSLRAYIMAFAGVLIHQLARRSLPASQTALCSGHVCHCNSLQDRS